MPRLLCPKKASDDEEGDRSNHHSRSAVGCSSSATPRLTTAATRALMVLSGLSLQQAQPSVGEEQSGVLCGMQNHLAVGPVAPVASLRRQGLAISQLRQRVAGDPGHLYGCFYRAASAIPAVPASEPGSRREWKDRYRVSARPQPQGDGSLSVSQD